MIQNVRHVPYRLFGSGFALLSLGAHMSPAEASICTIAATISAYQAALMMMVLARTISVVAAQDTAAAVCRWANCFGFGF